MTAIQEHGAALRRLRAEFDSRPIQHERCPDSGMAPFVGYRQPDGRAWCGACGHVVATITLTGHARGVRYAEHLTNGQPVPA